MNKKYFSIISVFAILYLLPIYAIAGSVKLNWEANNEKDLKEYRLYHGTSSRTYGSPITLGNVVSYTLSGLNEGQTYYFAVTAVDTSGNESGYSDEVVKKIVSSEPSIITDIIVSTGNPYELVNGLKHKTLCYVDKKKKYRKVPAKFSEALFIKTYFGDRKIAADSYFSFNVHKDVTVYVAYDTRVSLPTWLNNFVSTGERLKINKKVSHSLFAKDFSSESKVILGGAEARKGHMYTIIILPR